MIVKEIERILEGVKALGVTTIIVEQNAIAALQLADRAIILDMERWFSRVRRRACSTMPDCASNIWRYSGLRSGSQSLGGGLPLFGWDAE